MVRAALLDAGGNVVNVVVLPDDWTPDTKDGWQAPEGMTVRLDAATAGPGDRWDGREFVKPEPVVPPPSRLDELAAKETLTRQEEAEALRLLLQERGR